MTREEFLKAVASEALVVYTKDGRSFDLCFGEVIDATLKVAAQVAINRKQFTPMTDESFVDGYDTACWELAETLNALRTHPSSGAGEGER